MAKTKQRTFSFRGGVRVRDSVLACDASSGGDLIFLSHAQALDARAARALPRPRAGKRQILTTEATLALLGAAGDRLRSSALTPAFGRPFNVGGLRLELFAAGAMPGAASLVCEGGGLRAVYAGPTAHPAPQVRPADAVCVDGTFAQPAFQFPPYADAVAAVVARVQDALAAGKAPVVLVRPLGPALDVVTALVAAGLGVRAHRQIIAAAVAFQAAGVVTAPLSRFAGRLPPGEVLVWPPEAGEAGLLRGLPDPFVVLASPWAVDPRVVERFNAHAGIALSPVGGFADLLAYVQATGAREVAIRHAVDEQLAAALGATGVDAYHVGPPQQIPLF